MSWILVTDSLPQDPLVALRVRADNEAEIDRIRRDRVRAARAAGASWQQIGDALGISRQSAWEHCTADVRKMLSRNADVEDPATTTSNLLGAVPDGRATAARRSLDVCHLPVLRPSRYSAADQAG
jgi:hypothetical protein